MVNAGRSRPAALYLDTSALAKRYLAETGTSELVAAVGGSSYVATSALAYAEMRAAFARALREGRIRPAEHVRLVSLLDAHWPHYFVLAASEQCVREAGRLVDRYAHHALRGFDAIHLASALQLANGHPPAMVFGCWDVRLWRAAREEQFVMLPQAEPL